MRNVLIVRLFSLWVLIAVLFACKKEDNPVAPNSGRLSGSVQLWDDKTNTLTDNSGVVVTVDDVTSSSATTNAAGQFSFDNLPYDVHNLTLTRAGYGTFRLLGINHAANSASTASGTVLPAVQLGRLATTAINSVTLVGTTYNGAGGVTLQTTVNPAPTSSNRAYIRHFLSTDPAVSSTNYMYVSSLTALLSNNANSGFSANDLLAMGFRSGQQVYVRIYSDSFQSNSYTDPNTGVRVFPNVNTTTAPAVSFVMP